jgi:hypothetical protein
MAGSDDIINRRRPEIESAVGLGSRSPCHGRLSRDAQITARDNAWTVDAGGNLGLDLGARVEGPPVGVVQDLNASRSAIRPPPKGVDLELRRSAATQRRASRRRSPGPLTGAAPTQWVSQGQRPTGTVPGAAPGLQVGAGLRQWRLAGPCTRGASSKGKSGKNAALGKEPEAGAVDAEG